jgi:DNA-binding LytR/AlgR family response regulator
MNQLRILVVEDEFIIGEDIKAAVRAAGYTLFGLARSYEAAVELLKKGKPDFALIDITLNGDQTGLKLGRMMSEDLNIPYLYVTSHSDTGTLERVKLTRPSGYLLKPFKREAIYTAIEVAMAAAANQSEEEDEKALIVKRGEEKLRIRYGKIFFLESDGNYTNIQTESSKYTERKTLKKLLDEMECHPFIRVHKSYAVNKNRIDHFSRGKIFIGEHEIPIGRAYYDELAAYLHK